MLTDKGSRLILEHPVKSGEKAGLIFWGVQSELCVEPLGGYTAQQSPVPASPCGNRQLCCLFHIHRCLSLSPPAEISVRSCWGTPVPCPVCPSRLIPLLYCTGTGRRAVPTRAKEPGREGQCPWLTSPLPAGHHRALPLCRAPPARANAGPSLSRIICILPLSPASLLLCTTEIPAPRPLLPLMLFTFKC